MDWLRHVCSYIYPIRIELTSSTINHCLEIAYVDGQLQLNTKNAIYSFGRHYTKFSNAFKQINFQERPIDKVLMLGFGSGTVATLLVDEYQIDCSIDAVEIDPVVIELGKKYFDTDRFTNLTIYNTDAIEFLRQCTKTYDLLVMDVFLDINVPKPFRNSDFVSLLKKSLAENGLLLFNMVGRSYKLKQQVREMHELLQHSFSKVALHKPSEIFIAENSGVLAL